MGITFCKECNEVAIAKCDLCGSWYCKFHYCHYDSLSGTLSPHISVPFGSHKFNVELLTHFINVLSAYFPDPNIPDLSIFSSISKSKDPQLGRYGITFAFDGTFRCFYEKIYPKAEILDVRVCKYCNPRQLQTVEKEFFPVFQSAKESGLICAYYLCPLDAEKMCENCGKYFCRSHVVICTKCSKILCCSAVEKESAVDRFDLGRPRPRDYWYRCYGGCQSLHSHWRSWYWRRVQRKDLLEE